MPLLIQKSFSPTHPNRDLLINNRSETMIKVKKTNNSISNESDNILQVWPTSSERSHSSDDEKEQPTAFSESEASQIKAENAFTSISKSDRMFREFRHRRRLSFDDHQIWSKETEDKSAKRKRQDQDQNQDQDEKTNLPNEKAEKSLPFLRVRPQNHQKSRIGGQMEEANSTDSTTSSQSSANIYNTPVFSASSDPSRMKNQKSDDLSSGADSTTTFEDYKSPSPADKETEKVVGMTKNPIVPSVDMNKTKSQEKNLCQDQRNKSDSNAKIVSVDEIQSEKKDNEVNDSFPQMLVRAAQRSNTTTFNTAPQRKSCDRCFRMKTKCSRAQPGASTSGPCDGCIRRGFPHDCITSRPDFPHPRITLAKRPRLATNTVNQQSGTMQPLINNHAQENGQRAFYNTERVGNRQIEQSYTELYRYPTQAVSTHQKNLQPIQNSIMRREAWVKDQRNHPLPPLSNNISSRESSSIYRQRLYHNYGDAQDDQTRLSSLQQERTAIITSSLTNGQGNLTELSSEELYEVSTMVTGELLRRAQVKK